MWQMPHIAAAEFQGVAEYHCLKTKRDPLRSPLRNGSLFDGRSLT